MRRASPVFGESGEDWTAAFALGRLLILVGLLVVSSAQRPAHAQAWTNGEGGCIRVLDVYGVSPEKGEVRIVLVLDRSRSPKVFPLKEPPRLVIDLEPAELVGRPRFPEEPFPILRGPVRWWIHPAKRRLRIVLDLFPHRAYDVKQDLYMGPGQLGEGGRFVLSLREVPSP